MLVHPATSNEEGALLARLAEALGTGNLDHRIAPARSSDGAVAEAIRACRSAEIEQADAIVHRRLATCATNCRCCTQRVRKAAQARREGARVNPVDFDFAFDVAGKQIVAAVANSPARAGRRASCGERAAAPCVIVGGVAEAGRARAAAIRAAARGVRVGAHDARAVPHPAGRQRARPGAQRRAAGARAMRAVDARATPRSAYVLYGIEPGLRLRRPGARRMKALGKAQVVAFSHSPANPRARSPT